MLLSLLCCIYKILGLRTRLLCVYVYAYTCACIRIGEKFWKKNCDGKKKKEGKWDADWKKGKESKSLCIITIASGEGAHQTLIGVSCLVSNKMQGFLYDVYHKTRLVSSLQFMSRCQTLSFDGCFLHTLSSEAVDSYTTRVFASAMTGFPFLVGGKETWLSQVYIYICTDCLVMIEFLVGELYWLQSERWHCWLTSKMYNISP